MPRRHRPLYPEFGTFGEWNVSVVSEFFGAPNVLSRQPVTLHLTLTPSGYPTGGEQLVVPRWCIQDDILGWAYSNVSVNATPCAVFNQAGATDE